jgi:hypothetical protein
LVVDVIGESGQGRDPNQHHAHQQTADGRLKGFRNSSQRRKKIFRCKHYPRKPHRHHTRHHTEGEVEEKLVVRDQVVVRCDKRRMISQMAAGDGGGNDGGNHNGAKSANAETTDDDF